MCVVCEGFVVKKLLSENWTEVRAIGGDHPGSNVIKKIPLTCLNLYKLFLKVGLKPPFCTSVNISLTYSTPVKTVD